MTEIVEEREITARDQDGWTISYRVRRDDGKEVPVLASCTRTAESSAKSDSARAYLDDRGRSAALEHAERGTPARMIHLSVDPLNGSVRADFDRWARSLFRGRHATSIPGIRGTLDPHNHAVSAQPCGRICAWEDLNPPRRRRTARVATGPFSQQRS